jgi:uracil-DNA glycosylase family 4
MTFDSTILIELTADAELFHTPDGDGYATIPLDNHRLTMPIRSGDFRHWLVCQFYQKQGEPPGAKELKGAVDVLEARAQFDGPEHPVFLRVAPFNEKTSYLDLANSHQGEAVEITATGWQVVTNPPVRFRRTRGMLALPTPVHGGSIDELRLFANVSDDSDWSLLVAWLVATLRPNGPYPILILQGEQGSAKSTTARLLRALVDPSTSPLRTPPREARDLMIAANNAWILAFDNLSGMSAWLSDALCRLATGGGFAPRKLYTDAELVLFDAMRPIILNGINIITRQDLTDRALFLNLPPITERHRRDESRFWREFESARPRILGALCDAASTALRNLPGVELPEKPRMADFALWVTAAEDALPWTTGEFIKAYIGNRKEAMEIDLEDDPVAMAARAVLAEQGNWLGTATDLLHKLEKFVPERIRRSSAWPKSARELSGRLRRAAPFLRAQAIEITFRREAHTGRRLIIMTLEASPPSPPTPSYNPPAPSEQVESICLSSDRRQGDRCLGTGVVDTSPAPGDLARQADLEALQQRIMTCQHCPFAETVKYFAGGVQARVMVVGQAPNATNTARLKNNRRRAADYVFPWLNQLGVKEEQIERDFYFSAVLRCFPGKNLNGDGDLNPSPVAKKACLPFLWEEVRLVQPELLVAVGRHAIEVLLGENVRLEEAVGQQFKRRFGDVETTVIPLPHPSGLNRWLYQHNEKFAQAMKLLNEDYAVLKEKIYK